ncbi:hypothetical protein [Lactobacillus delbrueckii]|nr:hypothetical protein [Lactobacillus delbrueckii]
MGSHDWRPEHQQVEVGNHDSLMAKKGFYADLYQSQFEHSEE